MFVGRENEYAFLQELYERPGSQLIVFYGKRFLGKTSFLLDFCRNRPFSYFLTHSGCLSMQEERLDEEMSHLKTKMGQSKGILIMDEFQNLAKNSQSWLEQVLHFMKENEILVVLVSSQPSWVESSLVKSIGKAAIQIQSFYKGRELSFQDICTLYQAFDRENLFVLYCLLGGRPGLWNQIDLKQSVDEIIEKTLLAHDSYLRLTDFKDTSGTIRESGVYETLLYYMANGHTKLNQLHADTGFSRAKISVYLKTLIELSLIQKVYSVECAGRENSQKGIYEVTDSLTRFKYIFLYEKASILNVISPDDFYKRFVRGKLMQYCEFFFPDICREYLLLTGKWSTSHTAIGKWVGKRASIDLVYTMDQQYFDVAKCIFHRGMLTFADYEELLLAIEDAQLVTKDIFLFSLRGFDEKLILEARMKKNIHLITLKDVLSVF